MTFPAHELKLIAPRNRRMIGKQGFRVRGLIGLLLIGWAVPCVSAPTLAQQPGTQQPGTQPGADSAEGRPDDYPIQPAEPGDRKLSKAELKVLAAQTRIRKAVEQRFRQQSRTGNRFARKGLDDCFVVARLEMPLETRNAELRFEVSQGVQPSIDKVSEFLLGTPTTAVRDFMVVARFESLSAAEANLDATRKRYDEAIAYQAQLLAYLQQQQQVQAQSMRRC